MDHLFTNGEHAQSMNTAIECVVKAHDPDLSSRIVDFLLGNIDGIPKVAFSVYGFELSLFISFFIDVEKIKSHC